MFQFYPLTSGKRIPLDARSINALNSPLRRKPFSLRSSLSEKELWFSVPTNTLSYEKGARRRYLLRRQKPIDFGGLLATYRLTSQDASPGHLPVTGRAPLLAVKPTSLR